MEISCFSDTATPTSGNEFKLEIEPICLSVQVCLLMSSQSHNQNDEARRSVTNPMVGASRRSKALRILVVEDHTDTRRVLEKFLQSLGHRTQSAGDIQQALNLAAADAHFDLLLSDIRLPDGDGWELLRKLDSAGWRPSQAIAISGWGNENDLAKSKRAGFYTHIVKPFAPEVLEAALGEVAKAIHPDFKVD
jgi:CheY-like chemotaxis protein